MADDLRGPEPSGKAFALNPADQRDVPAWGKTRDGRSIKLEAPDAQLEAAFSVWLSGSCRHTRPVIHKWTNAGGAIVYRPACPDCGMTLGSAIKHADIAGRTVTAEPREFFERKSDAYRLARFRSYERIADEAAERAVSDRGGQYAAYLATPAWYKRRDAVLKRDGGLCQGCLSRPAEQVHHLTYVRIYNEMAFDLISLCNPCHKRIHA